MAIGKIDSINVAISGRARYTTGKLCPGCTVKFYSGSLINNQFKEQYFEGETKVDFRSYFDFQNGYPFHAPYLSAILFDDHGKLLIQTEPAELQMYVDYPDHQVNNQSPKRSITMLKGEQLSNNLIGGAYQFLTYSLGYDEVAQFITRVNEMGYTWVQIMSQNGDWADVAVRKEFTELKITGPQKAMIDGLQELGLRVVIQIVYWDPEIQTNPDYRPAKSEHEIQRILDYARFVVESLKGRNLTFSLFNEPNMEDDPEQYVPVTKFIEINKRFIEIVKEVDPEAKVCVGNIQSMFLRHSREYLNVIVNSDLIPLVDCINWHVGSKLSPYHEPEYYCLYPSMVDKIMATARRNGFVGEFFGVETNYYHELSAPAYTGLSTIHTPLEAGKYLARTIVTHLARGIYTYGTWERYWTNSYVVKVQRSMANIFSGAIPAKFPHEITSQDSLFRLRSETLEYSNGDRLLAVWIDGVALEDNPGVESKIILPAASANRIILFDPLNGFQQELVFNNVSGNLTIEGLMIKDYPLILVIEGYSQIFAEFSND